MNLIKPSLAGLTSSLSQTLAFVASVLIVAEDSLWLKPNGLSSEGAFSQAWENYQASSKGPAVLTKVREFSGVNFQQLSPGQKEEWVQGMCGVVKEFKVQPKIYSGTRGERK